MLNVFIGGVLELRVPSRENWGQSDGPFDREGGKVAHEHPREPFHYRSIVIQEPSKIHS